MITLHDLIKFVMRYRTNKVFKGFDEIEVYKMLKWAVDNNNIVVDTDPNCQHIYGLIIFTPAPAYNLLHINHVLTVDPDSIKRFVLEFLERFPGWDLQAERHGVLKRYKDTFKLTQRLLKKA